MDYRQFIKRWLELQPKKGRGLPSKMAEHLRVSTTMISQILHGDRHLNLELASELADFMALSSNEQEYFFLMIDYQKAGSENLKNKLKNKLQKEQALAAKLKERLNINVELPETAKTIFYSSWLYTGVRNLSAVPEFNTIDTIAVKLSLPRNLIQKTVDFLVKNNLLILKEDGTLEIGPQKTHLDSESHLVAKHHQNWRLQGFQQMLSQNEKSFFYTGTMSLSKELASQIRQELPAFIESLYKRLGPSPSEVVRCFNIDWFEY